MTAPAVEAVPRIAVEFTARHIPGGMNVCPSVCILTSGVRWAVSPKS